MVAENFQNNVLHTMVMAFVLVQVFQVDAKMGLDPKRFRQEKTGEGNGEEARGG